MPSAINVYLPGLGMEELLPKLFLDSIEVILLYYDKSN